MRLGLADLRGPWCWINGRWRAGQSWIEPYDHPALEHVLVAGDRSNFLAVRERQSGDHDWAGRSGTVHLTAFGGLLGWPGDFTLVELSGDQARVTAGQWGIAPMYLSTIDDVLHASWDLSDLRSCINVNRLVPREIARMLTLRFRYGHDTAFADVHRLTERSVAAFDVDGLSLCYPEPALHSRPRTVRSGADVLTAYETLLETATARHVYNADTTAVELSGGLDSANVAMTLADLHPGQILTAAMMMPGPPGDQQVRRRAEMRACRRFAGDVRIPALVFPPLLPAGPRAGGLPVSPYDEPYSEATCALLRELTEQGVRTVFTGLGGDEMVALTSSEQRRPVTGVRDQDLPGWLGARAREALAEIDAGIAPAAVITEVTLLAFACRFPLLLRAGCWPVSPLADPQLIRFGEQLPREWRQDKYLHRARLSRLGLSGDVTRPLLSESFAAVMDGGLRCYGLPLLRRYADESMLVDQGFVDGAHLAAVCRAAEFSAGGLNRDLYEVVALELALRSFS